MKKTVCIIVFLLAFIITANEGKGVPRKTYFNVVDGAQIPYDFTEPPYDNVTFKAWIEERPLDILTNESFNCGYEVFASDSFYFSALYVDLGEFKNWNPGETVTMYAIETYDHASAVCGYNLAEIEYGTDPILVGFYDSSPDAPYPLIVQIFPCYDSIDENGYMPESTNLKQNYPNPFNPTTTIKFDIEKKGMVSLNIYNQEGKIVRNAVDNFMSAGKHSVGVDLSNVSAGTYYYILKVDGISEAKKMVLVK